MMQMDMLKTEGCVHIVGSLPLPSARVAQLSGTHTREDLLQEAGAEVRRDGVEAARTHYIYPLVLGRLRVLQLHTLQVLGLSANIHMACTPTDTCVYNSLTVESVLGCGKMECVWLVRSQHCWMES